MCEHLKIHTERDINNTKKMAFKSVKCDLKKTTLKKISTR